MILLKNCLYVLAEGRKEREGLDILIEGTRIAKIGKVEETESSVEVLDCSGCIAVPGFANTHHHFYQTLTRNLPAVQNAKLFDWLRYLYEVWRKLTDEGIYWSSLLAVGELLKTGCTCTTDHHYLYPRDLEGDVTALQFQAASRLGIRFSPCRGSMSLSRKDGGLPPDSVVQTEEEILADSERVIREYHDPAGDAMRKIVLAPCSPFSVTRGLMLESGRLARSKGVRLHTHLAETADEDDYCITALGKRPLEYMTECGFVGEDVWYAHGIHFNDTELDLLAETGTAVCHCPSSNMRLGSGIARVREMIDRGITVSLGVDGSASNDSSDFLGEMRNAMLLQRVRYGAAGLTAAEALALGTSNGARVLGFDGTGALAEGKCADIAVFDLEKLSYAGALSDPPAALLFAGIDHTAEYTIVNGRIAVMNGRLTGADEEEIASEANRIAASLLRGA